MDKPMPKPDFAVGPTPSRAELTADMRALFHQEVKPRLAKRPQVGKYNQEV